MRELMMKCWDKDPEKRPKIEEIIDEIEMINNDMMTIKN
jgi:hypothetical protein